MIIIAPSEKPDPNASTFVQMPRHMDLKPIPFYWRKKVSPLQKVKPLNPWVL
jgi:hypothetical protein